MGDHALAGAAGIDMMDVALEQMPFAIAQPAAATKGGYPVAARI
jgi:pyruvate/oxaloacetate carboxyltransferase